MAFHGRCINEPREKTPKAYDHKFRMKDIRSLGKSDSNAEQREDR
jgi:hypothetical protein